MPGRVHDVDAHALVSDRRILGEDGDAALALELVRIHDALGHFRVGLENAALPEHGVDERRLAVVHVRDDGDVPDVRIQTNAPFAFQPLDNSCLGFRGDSLEPGVQLSPAGKITVYTGSCSRRPLGRQRENQRAKGKGLKWKKNATSTSSCWRRLPTQIGNDCNPFPNLGSITAPFYGTSLPVNMWHMGTLSIYIRYRPVRIGWCVREDNLDDVRRVMRLTHTLWGGRYNPVIPVNNRELANQLVDVFRVDVLYPAADDPQIHDFINAFPYLPWPGFRKELFEEGMRGMVATFLDIYHPVRHLFEEHIKDKGEPRIAATLFEWDDADPLSDALLACFGKYPTQEEIGKDYADFVEKNLRGRRIRLLAADKVPADAFKALNPSAISSFGLESHGDPNWGYPGLYVGGAGDIADVVNFWNLRAAGIELVFYDPAYDTRLSDLKTAFLDALAKRPEDPLGWRDRVAIWSKTRGTTDPRQFGQKAFGSTVEDGTWNGLNVKPPPIYINEQSVLASITESGRIPLLSFQLPEKPFYDELELHNQRVLVSIRPLIDVPWNEESTFKPPYIPELNEYYGREAHFIWNEARAEVEGLGIVTKISNHDMTIRGLLKRQLVTKIFEVFGIKAELSKPGRVAARLIQQMGGIQGGRVFKIAGVRKLIEEYGPLEWFTRSNAVQVIGQNDPVTGRPNFQDYEALYIEQREGGRLKAENAFEYLVKRGVFRVGLYLRCTSCELEFWMQLDDLGTEVGCEYCGTKFNITPQLRDRDWAFRRSGLFGKEDRQEGSVPVALTLQQLDTMLDGDAFFVTAMNLTPVTATISPCETDFVMVAQKGYGKVVQLALGECKAGGPKNEITEDDVTKLSRVADAFPQRRFETYIIFSKTSPFTAEEIARCRLAQTPDRFRVILLSDRELEPYFIYEKTEKEFDIRSTAISLEDLARNTHDIFFRPRRKAGTATL